MEEKKESKELKECDDFFDLEEEKQKITLDDSQLKAAEAINKWAEDQHSQRFILAGLAGTGKTTIIKHCLEDLHIVPNRVAYCAYTGKAAMVMRQHGTLGATTIHRLIYDVTEDPETGDLVFKKKPYLDEVDLIVVDEASMVSKKIQADLESFDIPIIYVGDHGQLPPIGDTFSNLMEHPNVRLEKIHRQAEGNPIIMASQYARQGQFSRIVSKSVEGVGSLRHLTAKSINPDLLLSVSQILCGKNRTRQRINNIIRNALGFESPDYPAANDRVICLQNEYQIGLINGMQGTLLHVEQADNGNPNHYLAVFRDEEGNFYQYRERRGRKSIPLTWHDKENNEVYPAIYIQKQPFLGGPVDIKDRVAMPFDYSYCITTHKAQGSQYDSVLILEERFGNLEFHKRWLYTAITRGIEKVVLLT